MRIISMISVFLVFSSTVTTLASHNLIHHCIRWNTKCCYYLPNGRCAILCRPSINCTTIPRNRTKGSAVQNLQYKLVNPIFNIKNLGKHHSVIPFSPVGNRRTNCPAGLKKDRYGKCRRSW